MLLSGQWGQRNLKSKKSPVGTQPGDCVSVNHLASFCSTSSTAEMLCISLHHIETDFRFVRFVRFVFQAHLRRLKGMVRIHRAQYKRVQASTSFPSVFFFKPCKLGTVMNSQHLCHLCHLCQFMPIYGAYFGSCCCTFTSNLRVPAL